MRIIAVILCVNFWMSQLLAQQEYHLQFQDGSSYIEADQFELRPVPQEIINNRFYRILQFEKIPNKEEIQLLSSKGVELLSYIPNNAYVASLDKNVDESLKNLVELRFITTIPKNAKLRNGAHFLIVPDWSQTSSEYHFIIKYYKDLRAETIKSSLIELGATINASNDINNFINISINKNQLPSIISHPGIAFIDYLPAPSIPDDVYGQSLHRANTFNNSSLNRNYTGVGVAVLCRDDGIVGPHIDFQGRIDNEAATFEFRNGTHGDGVSGIMSGAGNLNPRVQGMAPGSQLFVDHYQADFLDETMDFHLTKNVLVTNSSYSNGCNAGYTAITETVDQQMYENPKFLHVFSAGNSNNNNCGYDAGDQWGNITGGHKQGKNVIATANLFRDKQLVNSSSRGPAHDGRIKPDISAHGQNQRSTNDDNAYLVFGGTSGAAPGIAGVIAVLHEAYRSIYAEIADAALLKALVLNSANELGHPGPDFKFGWGHVNGHRALLNLENQQFIKAEIAQGNDTTILIDIPENINHAKLMLYWSDRPATVLTDKALVNDLDMHLIDPNGASHMPWILNSTSDPDSLDLPATRGEDHLNNMEQVFIDQPESGSYQVKIDGNTIPFGSSEFYLVWEFRANEIEITYPIGNEQLSPDSIEIIHWDEAGLTEDVIIDFSSDSGANWENIGTANSSANIAYWTVPESPSGFGQIRLTSGSFVSTSAVFSIGEINTGIRIEKICPDFISIYWSPLNGAEQYIVYRLGEKFMQFEALSDTNYVEIPITNPFQEEWFAIQTQFTNGSINQRSIAINNSLGLFNCQQENDLVLEEIINPEAKDGIICNNDTSLMVNISLSNTGILDQSEYSIHYQFDNQTIVDQIVNENINSGQKDSVSFNIPINPQTQGNKILKVWLSLANNNFPLDDTLSLEIPIYTEQGISLPFEEDFQNPPFPDDFWILENHVEDEGWEIVRIVDKFDEVTNAASVNNFTSNGVGHTDYFQTIPIDIENISDDEYLYFDILYRLNGFVSNDELVVEALPSCRQGVSDTLIHLVGPELATFTGDADETIWKTVAAGLSHLKDQSPVILKFSNINQGYGQIVIDNINIAFVDDNAPIADFIMSDERPCRNVDTVLFQSLSEGEFMNFNWDFGFRARPQEISGFEGPHDIYYILSPGEREVQLAVKSPFGVDTTTQIITVIRTPNGELVSEYLNSFTYQFSTDDIYADVFFWEFGDGNTSTEAAPIHEFEADGNYTVSLTMSNKCGESIETANINININSSHDPGFNQTFSIFPNPTKQGFTISYYEGANQQVQIKLGDISGKILFDKKVNLDGNALWQFQDFLAPGVYFIQIIDQEKISSRRLLVH